MILFFIIFYSSFKNICHNEPNKKKKVTALCAFKPIDLLNSLTIGLIEAKGSIEGMDQRRDRSKLTIDFKIKLK